MAGFGGLAGEMGQAAPVLGTPGGNLGGPGMTPDIAPGGEERQESIYIILETVANNGLEPQVIEALVMDHGQEIVEEVITKLQRGDQDVKEIFDTIQGGSPHEMPTTPAGGAMEYPMNPGMY
jgi:hypothetical protein|tara:strand:+ start:71 stop:436 length:366 start_codon:yes stop_codon:yes gene_type:complete